MKKLTKKLLQIMCWHEYEIISRIDLKAKFRCKKCSYVIKID